MSLLQWNWSHGQPKLNSVLGALQSYWDAFDPKAQSFASWIPGFYAEALAAAESEMHWLAAVLPGQSIKLATGLLEILFLRTDKSFRMRMSAALAQGTSLNTFLQSGICATARRC